MCRLCSRQASLAREGKNTLDVVAANRHGQQLFFANMFQISTRSQSTTAAKTLATTRAAAPPAAPIVAVIDPFKLTVARHHQPPLFDVRRDLAEHGRAGLIDRVDPARAAAVDTLVLDYGQQRGWTAKAINSTQVGIRILLGLQDEPGQPIRSSDVDLLIDIDLPAPRVRDVLSDAGVLLEDRPARVRTWFDEQIADLPDTIRNELHVWFTIMREGSTISPRRRPRDDTSIRLQLRFALPALRSWVADGHTSLREITRDDVLRALPASGNPRATTGQGLKSIFRVLKGRNIIFVNPTSRIAIGYYEPREPVPQNPADLSVALNSAIPATAALIALVAFHALRSNQLRDLLLTDLDGPRLHLGRTDIVLAAAVKQRLDTYLDYRTSTWPNIVNPHLFVNSRSAGRALPVGRRWIKLMLGPDLNVQAVREDRILDEAHASRGDTRRLTDLFGLSIKAASRYTDTVDHPGFTTLQSTTLESKQ